MELDLNEVSRVSAPRIFEFTIAGPPLSPTASSTAPRKAQNHYQKFPPSISRRDYLYPCHLWSLWIYRLSDCPRGNYLGGSRHVRDEGFLFLSKAGACLYKEQVTPLILSYPVQAVDSTAADDTFKSYFGGVEDCNDL